MPFSHQPYIVGFPLNEAGTGQYRMMHPGLALQEAGHALVRVDKRLLTPEGLDVLHPDILWWQQQLSDAHYDYLIDSKRRTGARVVYDFDDLVTDIPEGNRYKDLFPKDTPQRLRKFMKQADVVTVSTETLASFFRPVRSDIIVVPNRIPRVFLEGMTVQERPLEGRPKVGWAGGDSHGGDLALLVAVMEILGDEVEWVFMGSAPDGAENLPHTLIPPAPFAQFLGRFNEAGLDLALAPLEHNNYNRCKSNLRILEYGACSYPVLATDIDPYTDAPVFFPKNNSPEAWAASIRELVADRAALRRAGADLKNWVWKHFTAEDNQSELLRALDIPVRETPAEGRFLVSPGAMATDEVKNRLKSLAERQGPQTGAVCCWGNDAEFLGFPRAGTFTPINEMIHAHMNEAAGTIAGEGPLASGVAVPFPVGSVIYLSPHALAAIGDLDPHYGLQTSKLMDYGMRLRAAGFTVLADLTTFCGTWIPETRDAALAQVDFNRAANRHATLSDDVQAVLSWDTLSACRETMEATYLKQHYPLLPPQGTGAEKAYPLWCDLFEHAVPSEHTPSFLVRVLDGAEPSERLKASLAHQSMPWTWDTQGERAPDGAWVVYLHATDELHPDAFAHFAHAMEGGTVVNGRFAGSVVYGDEDTLSNGVRANPYFKPAFNYELLLSHNYIGTACAIRADRAPQGVLTEKQHYDLLLQIYEEVGGAAFAHAPYVVLHRAQRPPCESPVGEHFKRLKQAAMVSPLPFGFTSVQFGLTEAPLVSIIIPTKNNAKLLTQCLLSLEKTTYSAFEILVIDTGATEKEAKKTLEIARSRPRTRVLRDVQPTFNFSAVNNRAVARAKGEYICLLNDDTEVITPYWLDLMVRTAHREGVGAVGAKLLYGNNTVQHVGVVVGMPLVADHKFKGIGAQDPGYFGQAMVMHEVSAVTGACLLVKKAHYEAVGGLDESLAIAYNDVLFCLKLRENGLRNIIQTQAVLRHYESVSRGLDDTPEKFTRHLQEAARVKAQTSLIDPFWSPNLGLTPQPVMAWPPRTEGASLRPARPGLALINASVDRLCADQVAGHPVFALETADHEHLHVSYPVTATIRPLSIRAPVTVWADLLTAFGVQEIEITALKSLGADVLGLLARLRAHGFTVRYTGDMVLPLCPRENGATPEGSCGEQWRSDGSAACEDCLEKHGSAHGYVDVVAWRHTWGAFLDKISTEA